MTVIPSTLVSSIISIHVLYLTRSTYDPADSGIAVPGTNPHFLHRQFLATSSLYSNFESSCHAPHGITICYIIMAIIMTGLVCFITPLWMLLVTLWNTHFSVA
jgi:hypothetical protein